MLAQDLIQLLEKYDPETEIYIFDYADVSENGEAFVSLEVRDLIYDETTDTLYVGLDLQLDWAANNNNLN